MTELLTLSSGSKGNCTLIKNGEELILIDCGLSFKKLKEKLKEAQLCEDMITGVFITHEHGDHVAGLRVTADKLGIPAYVNQNTGAFLRRKKRAPEQVIFFENGGSIAHGSFVVEPFSIPHDGVDTVAFNVYCGSKKISVATDFGYPSQMVKQKLKNCDILLLESNYDQKMLMSSEKRPWKVKQRVLSRHGHLSNEDTMEVLTDVIHGGMKQLILGHVSQDTNDYSLVKDLATKHLEECGLSSIPLHVATQDDISSFFTA
jgi:phosphoribosyl 1,2-cyclic phosphodiesterase